MTQRVPEHATSSQAAADWLRDRFGHQLRIGAPLGLGKPNRLLNLLYRRAEAEPGFELAIYTALSLNPPVPPAGLAGRFLKPFAERQWGSDFPRLEYADRTIQGKAPPNVRVHEFYFRAGSALGSPSLQQSYQSINYTHVAQALADAGIHAILQIIARGPDGRLSLSTNPDLTLDVKDAFRSRGLPLVIVGVIHPDLPFLAGDAAIDPAFFDLIVDSPSERYPLFALPRLPVEAADHAIGFHASRLILDGGTLQIGIGSLSDAVVSALLDRHERNDLYRSLAAEADRSGAALEPDLTGSAPFAEGLYGLSEMITDGFMHLRKAGILSRSITDSRSGIATYLHGAFGLGSKDFYAWLRGLTGEDFEGLRMSRVSKVNDLYDADEIALRRQRVKARFLNTCMRVDLLGGAASDTLGDGRVVSGVGGQYNFVAMSHELPDARSILMLRSTRDARGRRESNLVPAQSHLTIPRHLRDLVVTEYGVADLRGKTDDQTIRALIEISDSEFQASLVSTLQKSGKLSRAYRLPDRCRSNTTAAVEAFVRKGRTRGTFRDFPFGSDFTPTEERLSLALGELKARTESRRAADRWKLLRTVACPVARGDAQRYREELERVGLAEPSGLRARVERRLVVSALKSARSFKGEAETPR